MIVMQIRFELNQEKEYHTCESRREGDWIIFTCSHCPEYENRINFKTEQRISHPTANTNVFHQGVFVPVGIENFEYEPN